MNFLIRFAVVLAFIFIIYKKRISPSLKKKKEQKKEEQTLPAVVPASLPVSMGYKVLAFDYAEHSGEADFASAVETRLSLLLTDIQAMGCQYRVDFMMIKDSVLVCLLSYESPVG